MCPTGRLAWLLLPLFMLPSPPKRLSMKVLALRSCLYSTNSVFLRYSDSSDSSSSKQVQVQHTACKQSAGGVPVLCESAAACLCCLLGAQSVFKYALCTLMQQHLMPVAVTEQQQQQHCRQQ